MTAPAPFRYAAFISYSHANEAEAGRLHRALENFRLPAGVAAPAGMPSSRGRIAPVFRDREELSSSPDLSAVIREALAAASALIVICSPKAKASRWVNEEIKTFKRMHGEGRVYALLIEGEPADAFPPALLKKLGPDGELSETEGEPLAADIRPGKDGWKLGVLKIAAGLLDTGLDSLRQREAQRERRQLLAVTGLSTAVAAGAIGLAGWALYASDVANRERARAEKESLTARRTADFMVELFEVPDPGESRGREVTAKEILDKGVARIELALKDEPAVQGELMYTMGRTYTNLGLYPDAARILAVARQKRIAADTDPADQYATENALARALFEKGDLDAAKALYAKLIDEAERDIAKGGWRVDYATANYGMGEAIYYADDPETAQGYYERARDLLAAHGLSESEEMAQALQGLAGSLLDQSHYEGTNDALLNAIAIYERKGDPENYRAVVIRSDLAAAYYKEGRIAEASELAVHVYESSRKLLGVSHPDTTIMANNLARYQFESGDLEAARLMTKEVLNRFADADREQHFDYVYPVNTAAEIELERGDAHAAIEGFRKALDLAKDNSNRLFGPINFNLGRALCEQDETAEGLEHVKIGRNSLMEHYEADDWRYGAADEFESRCRVALGERETARALAKSAYERLLERLGPEHFFTKRSKRWLDEIT